MSGVPQVIVLAATQSYKKQPPASSVPYLSLLHADQLTPLLTAMATNTYHVNGSTLNVYQAVSEPKRGTKRHRDSQWLDNMPSLCGFQHYEKPLRAHRRKLSATSGVTTLQAVLEILLEWLQPSPNNVFVRELSNSAEARFPLLYELWTQTGYHWLFHPMG